MSKIYLNMFILTGSYSESHRHTQNNNLEHKTHPKHQILVSSKNQNSKVVRCRGRFVNFEFWYLKWEAIGDPLEATEASLRAQILSRWRKSSPPMPPGPLKLRLFEENISLSIYI